MEKIRPRTLSGFMELLPAKQQQMERFFQVLRETYSLYGFTPLDTPVIESAEVLLAKGGGETEKQIYRFEKGDSDLALRFDLTVPLAKYVALNYGQLDILNEAEIPAVIYRTFSTLGLKRFQIRVNNRKILNGFYAMLGLTEKSGDIMRTVDKLDKIGPEKVKNLLLDEEIGLTAEQADEILAFIAIRGTNAEILEKLAAYKGRAELFDLGYEELQAVVSCLAAFGVPEENFAVDLTIARGLDYYTGTVYETTMLDYPEIGSICSGGRYDNLAEYYTDKKLPGVGISIGATRLFYVLEEQGLLNPSQPTAPADVLVIPMSDDFVKAVEVATALRDAGIRTQLYTEKKKFKAKIGYADKLGIPYVVFLGEDEIANNVITLKDMTSGEQKTLPVCEAVALLKDGLAAKNAGTVILEK